MGLHQVAVLAGDPVALDHLGRTAGDVGDLVQLDAAPDARGSPRSGRSRARPGRARRGSRGSRRRARGAAGARPRRATTGRPGGPARPGSAARPSGARRAAPGSCRPGRCAFGETPILPCIRRHHANHTCDQACTASGSPRIIWIAMKRRQVPPQLYFVVSAVFHYLGPSFAVLLFARVQVLGVAWLRIASAALVFALWRKPWRALSGLDRATQAAGRLGRRPGGDELLLLRGDRPAAARDGRRDRVPPRRRARGDRRAHAHATRSRWRSRSPACTSSATCSSPRSRWGSRSRSPTRRCLRPTSCSRTGWRGTRRCPASTGSVRRC